MTVSLSTVSESTTTVPKVTADALAGTDSAATTASRIAQCRSVLDCCWLTLRSPLGWLRHRTATTDAGLTDARRRCLVARTYASGRRTYIQSGNAVFAAEPEVAAALCETLPQHLADRFGFEMCS